MVYLETCLREEKRTYNSVQLAKKLKRYRGITLSPDHLRQVLKKGGDMEADTSESPRAPRPSNAGD